MSGREAIAFTTKGPMPIQFIDSGGMETGRKTGCAIMDLRFQSPIQIGELVLSNYYTAWMAIYVKREPVTRGAACTSGKPGSSGTATTRVRPQFERSISVDLSGSEFRTRNGNCENGKRDDLFVLETLHSTNPSINSRRRHSSGPNSGEVSERPWECSIAMKTLMPFPHFEGGCQDIFSIPGTESLIELRDVVILRLVLYQPSTVWKRFSVEDVNVYRNLPKRGYTQIDDMCRQREGWLATLRLNTKKMLVGQLVEPEKYESDDDGDP